MTTTTKPILLLDVDGVVNAFRPTRPHLVRELGGREVKGVWIPYTIRFDNEVVDMLDALAAHFEIHWATMWNQAANTEIAPALGIDDLPVMTCNHNAGWDAAADEGLSAVDIHRLWYAKTPLIPQYVGDQPFAWLDDDHSLADERYLAAHTDQHFRLVRTDADTGLDWNDVEILVQWATDLAAGTLEPRAARTASAQASARVFMDDPDPVLWFEDETPEEIDWDSDDARAFLAALDNDNA